MHELNYWQLGTWGRIPVSMHWTVFLAFVWFYLLLPGLAMAAIASVAFFALLVIHELGHVLVLRRRKIPIDEIRLYGIHGTTSHGFGSPRDEAMVAWGGVAAQAVVLIAAVLLPFGVDLAASPIAAFAMFPILFVFTKVNVLLMIVALLPIGPFDGRAAWSIFPLLRSSLRKRRRAAREAKLHPERALSPEKRRELEERSSQVASDLLRKLGGKPGERNDDA
jgi:Zn-dependent protease